MGDSEFAPGACQEKAGFLFSHACGDIAVRDCADCGKPICQRHSIDSGGLLKCVACAKAERANPNKTDDPNNRDTSRRRDDDDFDDNGPYFYTDSYYHSMGGRPRHHYRSTRNESHSTSSDMDDNGSGADDDREPDDFNDSDEAALMEGEPSADDVREFESDMGAS